MALFKPGFTHTVLRFLFASIGSSGGDIGLFTICDCLFQVCARDEPEGGPHGASGYHNAFRSSQQAVVVKIRIKRRGEIVFCEALFLALEVENERDGRESSFKKWLYRIAANATADSRRRRGRVEIRVIQSGTGKLLRADRETALAVDLAENVAGKTALENAAANLMDRIVPKLAAP
jgi:hypothetical protein